ncbi:uncharacterized protein LOC134827530 [Culicoides brevitarsis]|uniref:uncharacterized protein LOC134827530 n=1 Tax=Culicoides brevitarsis TaxID=469753 RepID=UPI00307BA8AD
MPVIMSNFKPPTCRRLQFDDEDDDEAPEHSRPNGFAAETADQNYANACLEEWRRQNRQESASRWNFDFETETPLPGPYVWERVDQNSSTTTVVEARVTAIETQQNHQNDLTEAMDCDVANNSAVTDAGEATTADVVNESCNKHHPSLMEEEQMKTPTKNG